MLQNFQVCIDFGPPSIIIYWRKIDGYLEKVPISLTFEYSKGSQYNFKIQNKYVKENPFNKERPLHHHLLTNTTFSVKNARIQTKNMYNNACIQMWRKLLDTRKTLLKYKL